VNLLIDCKGVKLLPIYFLHLIVQAEAPTAAMDEEMPLLKKLPHALSMYFAREVDNLEDAEIAQMNMLDWLSAKISDRVSASPSQRKKNG
jgi:hypothetical protein